MNYRPPLLTLLAAGIILPMVAHAQEHTVNIALDVKNNGSGAQAGHITLHFGVAGDATDCIDAQLGEEKYPPFPPTTAFEARLVDPFGRTPACLGDGVVLDLRAFNGPDRIDTFVVKFQPGIGGAPITFSWNPADFIGKVRSLTIAQPGEATSTDMLAGSSYAVPNANLPYVQIMMKGGGTAGVESGQSTEGYFLRQNLPNPVGRAGGTLVAYGLRQPSHVTLKLYNAVGMLVATIIDGEQEAGEHTLRLHTASLVPGAYYYTIVAGNFTATRTLVVLE